MPIKRRLKRFVRTVVLGAVSHDLVVRSPPDQPDVLLGRRVQTKGDIDFEGNLTVGHGSKLVGPVRIGRCTTLGTGSELVGPISIGRYCQLAPGFGVYSTDHPTDFLTTYVNQRLFEGDLRQNQATAPVTIGHGVWAGRNVTVLKGVSVGNGAVLGAGAIVSRDVAPYSIVTGTPARHHRFRFEPEIIERIEALAWWDMSEEQLAEIKPLFLLDLNADRNEAVRRLDAALAQIGRV